MTEPVPSVVVELIVGLDENYSFMNFLDPQNPTRLSLNLEERCEIVFTLRDQLILAGWSFQKQPVEFLNDYGINFSSYVWVPHSCDGRDAPRSRFKVIFECERMGIFHYSLFMRDGLGQNIDLDPDIENGAGRVP
jgi:hypothetical protein